MTTKDQVGERVRVTLHAKAASVDPKPHTFDPTRRSGLDRSDFSPVEFGRASSTGRRLWVGSAAAAALLVAVSIGVVVATGGGKPASVHTLGGAGAPTTTTRTAATALPLVPGWVPEGFQLWSIDEISLPASLQPDVAPANQRFEDGNDPSRVVQVRVYPHVLEPTGPNAAAVTVRGLPGVSLTGAYLEGGDAGGTHSLMWQEHGVQLAAVGQGIDLSDMVQFLDGLTWRGSDPLQGFAPAADARWRLTFDQPGGAAVLAAPALSLTYVDPSHTDATGSPLRLDVLTSRANAAAPSDPAKPLAADGSSLDYVAAANQLTAVSADGRSAQVTSENWSMSKADLTRVATSVASVDATRIAALHRDAAAAMSTRLPVIATASLDSATIGPVTVEVRGKAGTSNALCLVVSGARVCGDYTPLTRSATPMDAGVLVDGTWLVVAVAPDTSSGAAQHPEIRDGGPDGGALGTRVSGWVDAHADGWAMTLVAPPASIDWYTVALGRRSVGGNFRPAS
jgi:hypothetical protein